MPAVERWVLTRTGQPDIVASVSRRGVVLRASQGDEPLRWAGRTLGDMLAWARREGYAAQLEG